MRFGGHVVQHRPFGVPMIGNTENGYAIGLTEEGARLCARMFSEDVPDEEIVAVSADLLVHLRRGAFGEGDGPGGPKAASTEGDDDGAAGEPMGGGVRAAYLHVTHHCNLRCAGCYSVVEERNGRPDLSLDALRDIVGRLAAAGVQRLVISGGEPFLRDDLAEVARAAKEAGIGFVDLLTNGTVVTDEALAALAPWVDRVAVSFDGIARDAEALVRGTGRFDTLVDAVHRIQAAGIPAHIIPTLHGKNAGDARAYCDLADKWGTTLNFSLLSAPASDPALAGLLPDEQAQRQLARTLFDLGRERPVAVADTPVNTGVTTTVGCGAGCDLVSVSAEGDVYPCHMLHDPAFKIGSLLEDGSCLTRRRPPADCVDELDACASCEIRYLCGGGCRARAFFATGDARVRDPYCALMKTYYQLLFQALLDSQPSERR
ncbi:radical SAM protein [Enterorhabdus mucosicola]|uniref:Radical SAM protein n=2 Tax=Adlercreutzia mucosicola TaxID=580026 RepID=A0A6N8JQG5_9ACTN|nr:radical SAM protein [Adlercreutzia mucosicola]MVX61364.1 radical SAM protein [Adlercreutzia mucosicola]